MDFSKIKKIFYIIAIISMLLSIKSKVLGASNPTLNSVIRSGATSITDTYKAILPEFLNDQYWVIRQVNTNNGWDTRLYYADSPFYLTTNSSTGRFDHRVYMYQMTYGGVADTYTYTFTNGQTTDIIGDSQLSNSWVNHSSFSWAYGNFDFYVNGQSATITNFIPKVLYPYFLNKTEIEDCSFTDGIYITPEDYSRNDDLYFHLLQIDTGLPNSDESIYYYSDKTFKLNKDSAYFRTWVDPNIEGYYYYIPRYKLGLSQNTSYLYVLNNSKNQIQNSQGIYTKDESNGIFDVVESDTAGVITATEEESDRMKNIEQTLIDNQNSMNNIQNTLTDSNISQDTETEVDTNLNFNNSAPQFSSLFNGFFSRLTTTISDLGNYQDTDVITINLPIPFTNDTIPISSNFIFSNQNNNFLKNISTLLWYFIFGRYFLYFLINTYWLITNGQFFDNYLTQKEAITDDML